MEARLRSWWQQIKRPLSVIGIITASILVIALVVGIIGGYLFHWKGIGVGQKTLWDWMQLLFIPVVLAIAGFWFNHRERKAPELRAENERKAAELGAVAERSIEQQRAKAEQEITSDNQQETALQEYIDKMSELLLRENLGKSEPESEVRKLARVRTLTVLPRLNSERKGSVLQFLYEADLINKNNPIVDLQGAAFTVANLYRIDLHVALPKSVASVIIQIELTGPTSKRFAVRSVALRPTPISTRPPTSKLAGETKNSTPAKIGKKSKHYLCGGTKHGVNKTVGRRTRRPTSSFVNRRR